MQIVEPEFKRRRFTFLADGLLHLGLDLLDDLFDPRRMNAAVCDQPFDRLASHLAPERVKTRQDDCARGVVHDQLNAGRGFERPDIAAFAPDDAPFEIVAGQIHDRDGRLDRVLGGAPLDRVGNDLLRARRGGLARLGFQPLDQVGGIAPGIPFDLLQQQLARLVGAEPGDAL